MEKLGGVTILSLEGDAGVILNKGTLPTDWKNGLNKYTAIQGGYTTMKHACNGGEKFRIIIFTVKICCHKDMDVADELDSASMDLSDDNLNFKLKGIKCAYGKKDLMALMTYTAMSEKYTERMSIKTLNKAYQEHIFFLLI